MKTNLCVATALLAMAASACASLSGAAHIARDIDRQGARATVVALESEGELDAVLSKISTGDAAWVHLGGKLAAGTDASASTGLTIALATALPKNPQAVLGVLNDSAATRASAVCGVPFIEPSREEAQAYLSKAIPAVTRAPESAASPRTACLDSLRRVKDQLDAMH
jgi:hypothetical protein